MAQANQPDLLLGAWPWQQISHPPHRHRGKPRADAGRTSIAAYLDEETHQQFRILSVELKRSGQNLLIEALNDLFKKYGKAPIAQ